MFKASFEKRDLVFNFPAKTSRGALSTHTAYILRIENTETNLTGIGEAAPLTGLSLDDRPDFEHWVSDFCQKVPSLRTEKDLLASVNVTELPALFFAVEAALKDLQNGGKRLYFDNPFTKGISTIPVNGLVWMSDTERMLAQAVEKVENGFCCIKIKIGAEKYDDELKIIQTLRKKFGDKLSIRTDANGAFDFGQAKKVLKDLKKYEVHSVEQPIKPENWDEMSELCAANIVPIALDEELIGIFDGQSKFSLLEYIMPQFIILKPTLLGGIAQTLSWVKMAKPLKIGFWLTSALESNVGLNIIAQLTGEIFQSEKNIIPQGLGTGGLYENNFPSMLNLTAGEMRFIPENISI
jgi:o-succinylbenzoate synthase